MGDLGEGHLLQRDPQNEGPEPGAGLTVSKDSKDDVLMSEGIKGLLPVPGRERLL